MQCRGCGSGWQHSAQGASSSRLCGPDACASGQSSGRSKGPATGRTWRQKRCSLLERQTAKRFSASKGLQRVDFLSRHVPGSAAKVLQTSSEGPSREPCEVLEEDVPACGDERPRNFSRGPALELTRSRARAVLPSERSCCSSAAESRSGESKVEFGRSTEKFCDRGRTRRERSEA